MSDVLTNEQLNVIAEDYKCSCGDHVNPAALRAAEFAVVAALAARSGVDVEALAISLDEPCTHGVDEDGNEWCKYDCVACRADAIRLAIATVEARHEAREAMWRELRDLRDSASDDDFLNDYRAEREASEKRRARVDELRRELGLENTDE